MYFFSIFIFLFGLIIGSFLNVVICRLETGEDIVKSRSHCPKCGKVLKWFELFPVLSFCFLGGKCRYCGENISWQYPMVEAVTAFLFLFIFIYAPSELLNYAFFSLGYMLYIICYIFIVCALIIIFVYDLRHYIIPDKIIFPAIGAVILYQILAMGKNLSFMELVPFFLSAFGAAGFFLAVVLATRGKGMGMGDVKLAFLIGLLLGWPNILFALFFAFFSGAMVGIGLIIAGRKKMQSQIPFGPFLVGGTMVILLFGLNICFFLKNLAC